METLLERSKSPLDTLKIEEIISSYITLKKRGNNYIALCPFHGEKSPSFSVSSTKQIYKCFGCGKGGDAISFVMEYEKCDYDSAIKILFPDREVKPIENSDIRYNVNYGNPKKSIVQEILNPIRVNFESNIKSTHEFLNFDSLLLEFCITQIEVLDARIKNNDQIAITNPRFLPTNTLLVLKNIKSNESFKGMYETLSNQGVVLLVSYFTSALKEIFIKSIGYLVDENSLVVKENTGEFKFTLKELAKYEFNLKSIIGEVIFEKKNISFQDMKSSLECFKLYFDVDIEKDQIVDNVILAQAARHAIVHSLSIADSKFINQISGAKKRTLKTEITFNDGIVFTKDEVKIIASSLLSFIDGLISKIAAKASIQSPVE